MVERNARKNAVEARPSGVSGAAFEAHDRAETLRERELLGAPNGQDYGAYSADAHAVWSEVLARSEEVVARHADRIHPAYVEGLRALQLPDRVPRIEELNERLQSTGWKTVAVDGYLPATTYALLMAENVFPVSSRIRRREHIDFAPEPDMVHDILGHLPMLFCAEHREYLRELAIYASRAIPNELDTAYHEAVRRTAELKGTKASDPSEVARAEASLGQVYGELSANASEVTCLRRLYIWSIEFGMFGTLEDFTVHGAALMSAPTELNRVLSGAARLEPYSMAATRHENSFSDLLDRYFVASDYRHLHDVLSTYADTMHQSFIPGTSEVRELRPRTLDLVRRKNA
jgi:phenylalanine-4-hydroxylase